jgi:hypothetical protein
VKNVGEPCAGEPHARIDGWELETEHTDHGDRGGTADRETGGTTGPGTYQSVTATAPAPDPPTSHPFLWTNTADKILGKAERKITSATVTILFVSPLPRCDRSVA